MGILTFRLCINSIEFESLNMILENSNEGKKGTHHELNMSLKPWCLEILLFGQIMMMMNCSWQENKQRIVSWGSDLQQQAFKLIEILNSTLISGAIDVMMAYLWCQVSYFCCWLVAVLPLSASQTLIALDWRPHPCLIKPSYMRKGVKKIITHTSCLFVYHAEILSFANVTAP